MGEQVDLFLDTLISAPLKDERATMEFPFFALTKQPQKQPLEYSDGRVKIRVEPGPRGLATIWDKDVLIYIASIINDRIERGAAVDRTVTIAAYDLLRVCERGTGKDGYEGLHAALARLRSTTIYTDMESGGESDARGFGWIDDFRIVTRTNSRNEKVMAALEVTVSRWMFRAIVNERRVLTINHDYFRLKKGIERRIYELARKHCRHQPQWSIKLQKLVEKCGTTRDLRKFKADLKVIIDTDSLPDYRMSLAFDPASKNDIETTFGSSAGRRFSENHRMVVFFTVLPDLLKPTHR